MDHVLGHLPSFAILVNEALAKIFLPYRGFGQGDPMSHFLFVIVMEGLGRTIKVVSREGDIIGLKLHKGCPTTTTHE